MSFSNPVLRRIEFLVSCRKSESLGCNLGVFLWREVRPGFLMQTNTHKDGFPGGTTRKCGFFSSFTELVAEN